MKSITGFFSQVKKPLIIVSTIPCSAKKSVVDFLTNLNAPVYLEGVSGLREDPRLQHLRITFLKNIWELSVDGIFRIGGVPTHRIWRDLENKEGDLALCSYCHLPWPGLSWGEVIQDDYEKLGVESVHYPELWYREPPEFKETIIELFERFPNSEPALMRRVSSSIPDMSLVYLGNSMPIREWDLAAVDENKDLDIYASRGMNGIDGQLSTFLGMAHPSNPSNWCILGDLTALYDLAAPWILEQLEPMKISIVVINNGGGMIFSRMSDRTCLQNNHAIGFEHFAKMWNIDYYRDEALELNHDGVRLIEAVPCNKQTAEFWEHYSGIDQLIKL